MEAGRAAFDDEGGDALFGAVSIHIPGGSIHINDGRVGYAAIGDPGLGAIDDVAVAAAHGSRSQRGGIGAGLRFGKRVTADALAAREGRQEFFFLFLGSEAANGISVERILHREDDARGGAHAGNFLDYDGVTGVVEAGSAVAVGNGDAGQAQRSGLAKGFARKVARLVNFAREGLDFRFREFAHGALQERLLVGEREVHLRPSSRDGSGPSFGVGDTLAGGAASRVRRRRS